MFSTLGHRIDSSLRVCRQTQSTLGYEFHRTIIRLS